MIPTPGKKYFIACMGPYEYNTWRGVAICTENTQNYGDELAYEFQLSAHPQDLAYFISEDIMGEAV